MSSAENNPVYGFQVKRPVRIRVLQVASLVLAVAGLILLYLFSVNRDIPRIRIGEITPAMNFAIVRISGEVIRDTHIFQSGGMVFNLRDGSGEIAVMGGRAQAEALTSTRQLPRRGDRVDVAGSLSVGADQQIKLCIHSSRQLFLQRNRAEFSSEETPRVPLADVTINRRGDTVTVIGTLTAIDIPGPGAKTPYILTLEEGGAELKVVFWDDVFQEMRKRLPPPGKTISASGRIEVYQDTVQLKVRAAGDLQPVSVADAEGFAVEAKQ